MGRETYVGKEMLDNEVHLVKIKLDDTLRSPQRQVKEIIMGMTKVNPRMRMSISEVCSKLEGKKNRTCLSFISFLKG